MSELLSYIAVWMLTDYVLYGKVLTRFSISCKTSVSLINIRIKISISIAVIACLIIWVNPPVNDKTDPVSFCDEIVKSGPLLVWREKRLKHIMWKIRLLITFWRTWNNILACTCRNARLWVGSRVYQTIEGHRFALFRWRTFFLGNFCLLLCHCVHTPTARKQ